MYTCVGATWGVYNDIPQVGTLNPEKVRKGTVFYILSEVQVVVIIWGYIRTGKGYRRFRDFDSRISNSLCTLCTIGVGELDLGFRVFCFHGFSC